MNRSRSATGPGGADLPRERTGAAPLLEAGTTTGCLSAGDPADAFRLAAPAEHGVLYTFQLTPGSAKSKLCLYMHDDGAGDIAPAKKCTLTAGEPLERWLHVAAGTAAYVTVADHQSNPDTRSVGYTLATTAKSIPDPNEPTDDAFQSATAIELDSPHTAYVSKAANRTGKQREDWYRVVPGGPGVLVATLKVPGDMSSKDERKQYGIAIRAPYGDSHIHYGKGGIEVDADGRLVARSKKLGGGKPVLVSISLGSFEKGSGVGKPPSRYDGPYELTLTLE